jgi:hypothetical protein
MHVPFALAGAEHVVPHVAQLLGSKVVFVHVPLQDVRPCWQVSWQMPFAHEWPAVHATPQAPQFAESLLVSAQYGGPPSGAHSASTPPSEDAHAFAHAPFWQT